MSTFSNTIPEDGDFPHTTSKKILQRLNVDATAKLTSPGATPNNPVFVEATLPHGNTVVASAPALLTRPAGTFALDVARGMHPQHSRVHKFGYNDSIPNGAFADVHTAGGTYQWPTADVQIRIRAGGDAADDASGGLGARKIMVEGLDGNFNFISEILNAMGVAQSFSSSLSFRRISRVFVLQTGAYGVANTGDIIIESSGGDAMAHIQAGIGQTQQTHYTVPAGKTAFLSRIHAQVAAGTNKDATVRMFQRLDAGTTAAPFGAKRLVAQYIALQGPEAIQIDAFVEFPEKTDLWFDAAGTSAGTGVNVTYDLLLV